MRFWRRREHPSVAMLTSDGRAAAVEMAWVPDVRSASSPAAADWIAPRLLPWREGGVEVGSVVPVGFERYVRIDHGSPTDDDGLEGTLPQGIAEILASTLARGTETQRCWMAVWVGWGDVPAGEVVAHLGPWREYFLLEAPLTAVAHPLWTVNGSAWDYQSPSLWWPDDMSVCVATEIDAAWTYVGGSEAVAEALLRDDRLTTREVGVGDDFIG